VRRGRAPGMAVAQAGPLRDQGRGPRGRRAAGALYIYDFPVLAIPLAFIMRMGAARRLPAFRAARDRRSLRPHPGVPGGLDADRLRRRVGGGRADCPAGRRGSSRLRPCCDAESRSGVADIRTKIPYPSVAAAQHERRGSSARSALGGLVLWNCWYFSWSARSPAGSPA
jgi:hypothetical protein